MASNKILSNNRLVHSEHYGRIMNEYNTRLKEDGRVNSKKFYREVVSKLMPDYALTTWYDFIRKCKAPSGEMKSYMDGNVPMAIMSGVPEPIKETTKIMLSNQAATQAFIQSALNIAAARAKELMEHPELLTAKEALDLGTKAMKAQDSRIHAIGKIREDDREQAKFDKAFDNASYG